MVPWIGVQLTWEEVMFVCLKPVAAVIVARVGRLTLSHHVVISDPSNSTNHIRITFPDSQSYRSDITMVIKRHSVYHTVPEKEPK